MDDRYFMIKALAQAEKAFKNGEFPVGCIIVSDDRVISTGSRKGTSGISPSEIEHAEILALKKLGRIPKTILRNRLSIYTTLEPCLMCFGAILLHGITKIVYAYEDVMGGGSRIDLTGMTPLYRNLSLTVIPHVLRERSIELLKEYFIRPGTT
ncbi:MAG: nucleoside deaminase, partial [Thermodesulfobacteriota bacterium]